MSAVTSTRIDLRVDPYKKSIISRAAEMLGVDITQFIIDRVYPEAEKIVSENYRLKLSKSDFKQFCTKLDEPPKDLPALRRLLQEKSIFLKS